MPKSGNKGQGKPAKSGGKSPKAPVKTTKNPKPTTPGKGMKKK